MASIGDPSGVEEIRGGNRVLGDYHQSGLVGSADFARLVATLSPHSVDTGVPLVHVDGHHGDRGH